MSEKITQLRVTYFIFSVRGVVSYISNVGDVILAAGNK